MYLLRSLRGLPRLSRRLAMSITLILAVTVVRSMRTTVALMTFVMLAACSANQPARIGASPRLG